MLQTELKEKLINTILIELPAKPKLIISRKVWSDIFYLHKKCGNTEWSGILWLDTEGIIEKPEELKLTAIDFTLRDIGSSSYTEYDFGIDIFDIYDEKPYLMGKKIGQLHTHHNMNVFFSGTDLQCLKEVAPCHNYFVSLIVNIKGDLSCKIAVDGIKKYRNIIKKENGTYSDLSEVFEEKVTFVYNVNIEIENDLDIDIVKYTEANNKKRINNLTLNNNSIPFSKDDWNNDFKIVNDRQLKLDFKEPNQDKKTFETKVKIFLAKLITTDLHWTDNLLLAYEEVKQQLLYISPIDYKENIEECIDIIFDEIFNNEEEINENIIDEVYKIASNTLSDSYKYKSFVLNLIENL